MFFLKKIKIMAKKELGKTYTNKNYNKQKRVHFWKHPHYKKL